MVSNNCLRGVILALCNILSWKRVLAETTLA